MNERRASADLLQSRTGTDEARAALQTPRLKPGTHNYITHSVNAEVPSWSTSDFRCRSGATRGTPRSGVIVQFYEYPTREAWLAADSVQMRNPDLFDGDSNELAAGAKRRGASSRMNIESRSSLCGRGCARGGHIRCRMMLP